MKILGFVEDLEASVSRYRVQVVPLLNGAGIKGKLLHSLACSTPVVTTRKGVEGLEISDEQQVLIAEDPDEFANQVIRLYRNPGLWRNLQQAGRKYVEQRTEKGASASSNSKRC